MIMNWIELCLTMIILVLVALLFSGCEEQLANKPDLWNELLNLQPQDQAKWDAKYGDSLDSKQTANIVLAIQVINRQGEAIKQLDSRLVVLEANAIMDGDGFEVKVEECGRSHDKEELCFGHSQRFIHKVDPNE